MLTRAAAARTALLATTTLLASTAAVLATAPAVLAQTSNCTNDGSPYINPKDCDWGGGQGLRHIGEGPIELSVPAGSGGRMCRRPPPAVPNDSNDDAAKDQFGPQEISCVWEGVGPVPHPRGYYSAFWDCYMRDSTSVNVPDPDMPGYEEYGDDGLVYRASCFPPPHWLQNPAEPEDARELGHWHTGPFGAEPDPDAAQWNGYGELVVVPEVPPAAEPEPSLLELWVEAINSLTMHGPEPATAPPLDTSGLVNLPVWLWTEDTDRTWPDELSVTVSGGAWTIDAFAEPLRMEWEMGDGNPSECPEGSPGVAYDTSLDFLEPPEGACRYTYRQSSRNQPDGVYEILALTTWYVWWYVNGEFDNDVEFQVGNYVIYEVDELQVLTNG